LRLSFSAWLYFPFGRNHEGWGAPRLAPLLLALQGALPRSPGSST
jgi:hypothetical protein